MWWRTERSQVTNAIKPFSTIENVLDDAWDGFAWMAYKTIPRFNPFATQIFNILPQNHNYVYREMKNTPPTAASYSVIL